MPGRPVSGSGALVGLLLVPWLLGGLAWWLLAPSAARTASASGPAPPGATASPPTVSAPDPTTTVSRAPDPASTEDRRPPDPGAPAEPEAVGCRILEGCVLDDGGRPVSGVWVQLLPGGDPEFADASRVRSTVVDAEGRFRFVRLGAGPWRIQVREPEQPAVLSEELGRLLPGPNRHTLVVPQRTTLRFTLEDEHGRGLPDLAVRLTPCPAGSAWLAATDDAGTVSLRFLEAGRYTLQAHGPGLRWEEDLVLDQTGLRQETRRIRRRGLPPVSRPTRTPGTRSP